MSFIQWSDLFLTGIEEVDRQHFGLVDRLNTLAPLLSSGEQQQGDSERLLDDLTAYAQVHFSTEEHMMADRHMDAAYVAHHVRGHQGFVEEVGLMRRQLLAKGALEGRQLLNFLASWLTFHILVEDQRMARQLHFLDAGHSAEEAVKLGQDRPDTPAQAVLTGALIELFSVVTQRNKLLVQANEQLGQAKASLSALNVDLENQVAARTRDLQQTNAELIREQDSLRQALDSLARTQSRLLQSEKMAAVGQLAAGVAHEINNPIGFVSSNLNTLKTYADQLLQAVQADAQAVAQLASDHPTRKGVEKMHQDADIAFLQQDIPDLLRESAEGLDRVRKIVLDLKDFARVDEAGWQEVDLNQGLESTLNVAWNELKYKVTVVREYGTLPPVRCIPAQINQVFLNLLINAGQAIETKGTITLRSGHDDKTAWVEIADSGKGIPQDIQDRIFEPFFTTKPVGKGTGLGLSISWDIIQRHKGSIRVASQPGQGTVFRITLPLKLAAAA